MKPASKLTLFKRRPISSVLGLALDGDHLEGAVVHQRGGTLQIARTFAVRLALDPLTHEPALVGREILNQLETAGVRERRCVVALPLKWALTVQTRIPPLPETDVAGFLQIEAERGFPCDAATLRVAASRSAFSSEQGLATLVGIPAEHLKRLEQALRAARLKPLSFVPGVSALQPPDERSNGVLALAVGRGHVSMQVTCGGGIAALRDVEGATEAEAGPPLVPSGQVIRETRITLGQLAPEQRADVKRVRIFGPAEPARQLAAEAAPYFESQNFVVECADGYAPSEFGVPVSAGTAVAPALSLAARYLTGNPGCLEFLPPYVPPWKRIMRQCASGRLRTAGAVAGAVLVLAGGAFGFQQWQLISLRSQWEKIAGGARDLKAVQQQIQQYRPWFDESVAGLSILRDLTLAFPEDGSVTAKSVEMRDACTVSCGGTARDRSALLQTLVRLRAVDGVHDVKVEQIRGKAPLQFTFTFAYETEVPNDR